LLALLLRPLMLETGSVKGIVPPFRACCLASDCGEADGGGLEDRRKREM
jgi:hypothetical protein